MPAPNAVTVTWDVEDIVQAGTDGAITFTLSGVLTDSATGDVFTPDPPYTYPFSAGTSAPLVANDNSALHPAGSTYTVTLAPDGAAPRDYGVTVNYVSGATQSLGSLIAEGLG